MSKHISSLQNPAVKRLLQLQEKARTRRKDKAFVVEGVREIGLAIKGGYKVLELYFNPSLLPFQKAEKLIQGLVDPTELSSEVYEKLAYRESTEGAIALFASQELTLDRIHFKKTQPLILVAEAPEKPGNIGALLRTADAASIDAVIIANPRTDIYNPNIIRSSVGCVFTNQIATGTSAEIISFLKTNRIRIFSAALQNSTPYHNADFTGASAIVVGTEATGLSQEWLTNSTENIMIPMEGQIDSMNVSVAAGILIFEAKRQRRT